MHEIYIITLQIYKIRGKKDYDKRCNAKDKDYKHTGGLDIDENN